MSFALTYSCSMSNLPGYSATEPPTEKAIRQRKGRCPCQPLSASPLQPAAILGHCCSRYFPGCRAGNDGHTHMGLDRHTHTHKLLHKCPYKQTHKDTHRCFLCTACWTMGKAEVIPFKLISFLFSKPPTTFPNIFFPFFFPLKLDFFSPLVTSISSSLLDDNHHHRSQSCSFVSASLLLLPSLKHSELVKDVFINEI